MSNNRKNLKEIKISFAGLDNAGKTSALIALRQKYNFQEKVKNLKPTIKVDYSSFTFLNRFSINLWDMGGQEKYRSIYVNNPIYFSGTDYLYFLIDIQDELQFQTAVDYLFDLISILEKIDYNNEIIICFHKYDPKLRENEDYLDRTKMIKNLILSEHSDLNFIFFKTSVYDISSISKAVSYAINRLLNLKTINKKFDQLIEQDLCKHAILYTNSGLIIADEYSEVMDTRDFQQLISDQMNEDLEFFQRLSDEEVHMDERITFNDEMVQYVKRYELTTDNGPISLYIGISTDSDRINHAKLKLKQYKSHLETLI